MATAGGTGTSTHTDRGRAPAREPAKLYVISGSHACKTGKLLLEHKSIAYRTVELPTGLHPQLIRLHGFGGSPRPMRMIDGQPTRMSALMDRFGTVPALRIGDEKVQRNMEIARYLDRLEPDPPLFPEDPELRAKVEEAAAFGDEPLQMAARRIVLAAGARDPAELHARGAEGRLGPLLAGNSVHRRVMSQVATGVFSVRGTKDAELVAELPPMLDRIDAWTAEGVLNGEQIYVADLVIAPSLALLDYRLDLREELRARPGFALVERLLPEPA